MMINLMRSNAYSRKDEVEVSDDTGTTLAASPWRPFKKHRSRWPSLLS